MISKHRRNAQSRTSSGLRRPLTATAIVVATTAGVGVLGTAAAFAATPSSYAMHSSDYTIAAHHTTGDLHAMCATGYHVDGAWVQPGASGPPEFSPNVTVSGDDITRTYSGAQPSDQNGTDSSGNPTYQGFHIDLYNWSLLSSHTGSFTWTCDAN